MRCDDSVRVIRFDRKPTVATCSICGEADDRCVVFDGSRGRMYAICELCARKLMGYGKHYGIDVDVHFDGTVCFIGVSYPWTLNAFLRRLKIDLANMVRQTVDPIDDFLRNPNRYRRTRSVESKFVRA